MERLVFRPEHRSAQEYVTCAEQSHPVSQDGLEVAPAHENRPVLQNLFLLWLCFSWLVPVDSLLSGTQVAAPPPWQESHGKAMQTGAALHPEAEGALMGSRMYAGQLATAKQGPAGARGHETLAYSRRIIPAGCGAGVLAASWSHHYGRKR